MNFGVELILQINTQSLLIKNLILNQPALFLGLGPESDSSHLTWSSPLTVPGSGARAIASGPLDSNQKAHVRVPLRRWDSIAAVGSGSGGCASSSSSRTPRSLALSLSHGREWVTQRLVASGQRSTGL